VAVVVTGRLTELSLGTASLRLAEIALWVLFVWLAIYTQVKTFDRLTR
jgi:hypothetical protein